MTSGAFRFAEFCLDPGDRQLTREGVPIELSNRYFDALVLLVEERGRLVSKERFLDAVWRGVPVTDEALTQCIKTLRRQLGDAAGRPRFIETVPKHGYRFIAPVEQEAVGRAAPSGASGAGVRPWLLLGLAGTIGAGLAGLVGGLVFGFAAAAAPGAAPTGSLSVVLVLLCLTILAAVIGGAGVSFGIAGTGLVSRRAGPWAIAGGALGGLMTGGFARLLGLDAFNLLLGRSPADITGAAEGLALGAAVGLGSWLAARGASAASLRRGVLQAALVGASAGAGIVLLGGRLMAGSLDRLAASFPASHLRLDPIGALVGEQGLGPISGVVTGALEGGLFAAGIVGAMIVARRDLGLPR